MSVAKPWMLASPAPATSHWSRGVPGRQFSASISLPGTAQEAWAPGAAASAKATASTSPASRRTEC